MNELPDLDDSLPVARLTAACDKMSEAEMLGRSVPDGWHELLQKSRDNCLRNFGASTMGSWAYADLEELFSAAPAPEPEKCGHCGRRVLDAPWPVQSQPERKHTTDSESWDGHRFKEVSRGVWLCECGKQITESAT